MPYCPKCGDEYDEGYTMCADCGVPLVEGGPAPRPEETPPAPEKSMKRARLMTVPNQALRAMVVEVLEHGGILAYVAGREAGSYMSALMGYSIYGEDIYVDEGDLAAARELTAGMMDGAEAPEAEAEEQRFFEGGRGRARILLLFNAGVWVVFLLAGVGVFFLIFGLLNW